MADVFISYRQADREQVEPLVGRLEAAGFSVWWDERIGPQGEWDETIEREIDEAHAVVVCWTGNSVKSKWVRTEAHYAQDRGKLAPVKLDRCTPPIAFLLTQTADLAGWTGDAESRQWRKLLSWVQDLVAAGNAAADGAQGEAAGSAPAMAWRAKAELTQAGEEVIDGATVSRLTPGGTFFRDGEAAPLMAVVPAGAFTMGSPVTEPGRRESESPTHIVDFARPFAIGVYPVTFAEWDRLQAAGRLSYAPADQGWGRGELPVINVSWRDANAYAAALCEMTGETYRLPSEAEWEYACRAGSSGPFSFAEPVSAALANYDSSQPYDGGSAAPGPGRTCAVGTYPANGFGLYDMHGNVREWTADRWHDTYADAPGSGLARTDGHSPMRVMRGGSWIDGPWFVRSAARGRGDENDRLAFVGFRVAREIG